MIVRLWLAVLIAELLTAVAFKPQMADLPILRSVPKTRPVVELIPLDTLYTKIVNKTKTEFHVLIHQDTGLSLSVIVTPCNTRIDWGLKFIPHNGSIMILGNNTSNELGTLLVDYTGVSIPITYEHSKAKTGLYVITVKAADDKSSVMFYVSLKQRSSKRPFDFRPNGIKIKNDGQKIILRWNPSHVDQHLTRYSLVISTTKIYSTLCEAESRLEKKLKWNYKSNNLEDDTLTLDDGLEVHHLGYAMNYTLTDLIYDKTYYFTVFSLNESRMTVQHANATYKFQRPKPIGLKDAKPKSINLRAQNGKASFRYKVRNRPFEGSDPNTLYWYVMPCGGVVNVEIRCRKTLLVKKRVFGYEKLILNNTKHGERYVLKVEAVSADETQRISSVEVMATIRPMMFPMPDMPSDLSVRHYVKSDDCNSVTIGWLSAKSYTDLRYCVYLQEYKYNYSVELSLKPDQCELSYGNNRRHTIVNKKMRIRCLDGGNEAISVEKILKLKPSTTYIIQVTVTKPKGRTLSYDLLKLDTNSCGLN